MKRGRTQMVVRISNSEFEQYITLPMKEKKIKDIFKELKQKTKENISFLYCTDGSDICEEVLSDYREVAPKIQRKTLDSAERGVEMFNYYLSHGRIS